MRQWLQVSGQQSAQKTEEWQVIQLQIFAWIPEKLSFIHSLIRAEEHTTAAERRGHSLRLWGIGMLEERGAGGYCERRGIRVVSVQWELRSHPVPAIRAEVF